MKIRAELLRRFLERGPRGRMTSANRKVVACQYCHLFYAVQVIDRHETYCPQNPEKPRTFRSLGKNFLSQKRPEALDAPDIRIACLVYDGRSFPVLLDDALVMLRLKCVVREGIYRHRGVTLQCFVAERILTVMQSDLVWDSILKARKAGASLLG